MRILLMLLMLKGARAGGVELNRREMLAGSASVLAKPKLGCAKILAAVPEGALLAPTVRSVVFTYMLEQWPDWASHRGSHHNKDWPPVRNLSVHENAAFMNQSPQVRREQMVRHLLDNEQRIEQSLREIPARLARRLNLPLFKSKNLTQHFFRAVNGDYHGSVFTWMSWHREFYLQATEELEAIEPDLVRPYRYNMRYFYRYMDRSNPGPDKDHMQGDYIERNKLLARLWEFTDDEVVARKVFLEIAQRWWSKIFPKFQNFPMGSYETNPTAMRAFDRYLDTVLPTLDFDLIQQTPAVRSALEPTTPTPLTSLLRLEPENILRAFEEELAKLERPESTPALEAPSVEAAPAGLAPRVAEISNVEN